MKLLGGSTVALHWAIDGVRKVGVVSSVGVYGPTLSLVKIGDAVNKGLTLRMNQASVKRNLRRCFEHIQAGHIRSSDVITHRFPLEEIGEAYHLFAHKLDGCIKPMLLPPTAVH